MRRLWVDGPIEINTEGRKKSRETYRKRDYEVRPWRYLWHWIMGLNLAHIRTVTIMAPRAIVDDLGLMLLTFADVHYAAACLIYS